jgi:hypothetical protein
MPLYSLDNDLMDAVGQGEHWKLFEHFEGAPLHAAFLKELQAYLDQDRINSSRVGFEILSRIGDRDPELLRSYDQLDGLFGMTLWNLLAQREEAWFFYPHEERKGRTYFRSTSRET